MYRSPNIVRVIRSRRCRSALGSNDHPINTTQFQKIETGSYKARMEDRKSAFKILTVKPKVKTHLGRPRRRCEDNIRVDLK